MAKAIGKAVLELTIDDKEYRFKLGDAGKRAQDTAKDVASIGKLLKAEAFLDFAKLAVQAVAAVGEAIVDLSARGAEVEGVQASFVSLTGSIEESQSMLESVRGATKGLITDFDLMAAGNKALLLGLPVTAESLGTMGQAAVALGRAMKQDAAKSFDDLITALGRASPMILDNLGLSVKVGEANEIYARSVGKTAEQLTDAEKKQAFYNAAMAAAAAKVQELGGIHLTLADMVNIAMVQFKNFTDQLGVAINRSPVLRAGMLEIGKAMGEAFGTNQGTVIQTIVRLIEDVAIALAKVAVVAIDVAQFIANAWFGVNVAFSQGGSLMMTYFKNLVGAAQVSIAPLQQLILALAAVADAAAKLPVIGAQYAGVGDTLRGISAGIQGSFSDVTREIDQMRQGFDRSTAQTLDNAAATNAAFDSVGKVVARIPAAMEKARASQNSLTAATQQGVKASKDDAEAKAEQERQLAKNEETMRKLGPTAKQVAEEFQEIARATKLLGGVANLTDGQLIALVKKLQELAQSGHDNEEVFAALREAMREVEQRGDDVAKAVGLMTKEMDKVPDAVDPITENMEEMADQTMAAADVVAMFGDVLRELGVDADSVIGGLAGIAEGMAGIAAAAASGDIKGAVSGIFSVAAQQFKFGQKHLAKTNKVLLAGAAALSPILLGPAALGGIFGKVDVQALLEGILGPLKEMTAQFERQKTALQLTNEAANRYGLTIDELGPKHRQMLMDERFGQLIQDWELLKASGADLDAVIRKMAPSFNELVQMAMKTGTAIPEALRGPIEKMLELGLLVDENGNKMESLEGITWTKDLSAGLQDLVTEIGKLVEALEGIPNISRTVTITVNEIVGDVQDRAEDHEKKNKKKGGKATPSAPPSAPGGKGGGEQGFATGTPWLDFMDFGAVSPILAHNQEAIIPRGSGHLLAREIAAALPTRTLVGGSVPPGAQGQPMTIHSHIYIGGQKIDEYIDRRRANGYIG